MDLGPIKLVRINRDWYFDRVNRLGYKVETNRKTGELISYGVAFKVVVSSDGKGTVSFEKYIGVPTGVMCKAKKIVTETLK